MALARAIPRSPRRGAAPAATVGASHLAAIPCGGYAGVADGYQFSCARTYHRAIAGVTRPRIVLYNGYLDPNDYGAMVNATAAPFRASIITSPTSTSADNVGGTLAAFAWSGAAALGATVSGDQITIPAGGIYESDPVNVTLAPGEAYYIQIERRVVAGDNIWAAGRLSIPSLGERYVQFPNDDSLMETLFGLSAGTKLVGLTDWSGVSNVFAPPNDFYAQATALVSVPCAVVGTPTSQMPSVILDGDSIVYGWADTVQADGLIGFARRGFQGRGVPYICTATPGRSIDRAQTAWPVPVAYLMRYGTALCTNMGANDRWLSSNQLSTLTEWYTRECRKRLPARAPVYRMGLTPYTTETGGSGTGFTVGNQTPVEEAAWPSGEQWGLNFPSADRRYDIASAPLHSSGQWLNGYTTDGIHPNATSHAVLIRYAEQMARAAMGIA